MQKGAVFHSSLDIISLLFKETYDEVLDKKYI